MSGKQRIRRQLILVTLGALVVANMGCSLKVQRKTLHQTSDLESLQGLDGNSPWLKAHLPNGDLYLLSNWQVDESRRVITGEGSWMDARRDVIDTGPFVVQLDSVAIFDLCRVMHNTVDGQVGPGAQVADRDTVVVDK